MVKDARQTCVANQLDQLHASSPCSRAISIHCSFDFAQQVHLPSNPLQPGPLYSLVPRKVGLFGVGCEGIPKQVNYIIDEAHLILKGWNAVVSYLNHFLKALDLERPMPNFTATIAEDETKIILSCGIVHGGYALGFTSPFHSTSWLQDTQSLHPTDVLGFLKRAFKRHAVLSLEEFETVLNESACVNQAQLIGNEDGTSFVSVGGVAAIPQSLLQAFPGIKCIIISDSMLVIQKKCLQKYQLMQRKWNLISCSAESRIHRNNLLRQSFQLGFITKTVVPIQ